MQLLSRFKFWNVYNLNPRLNASFGVFMSTNCGLLSEYPKLKKFISYRLMPQIRVKSLFLISVITIGILSACFTALNGEEVEDSEISVKDEELERNPFSLPTDVSFVKKKEEVGTYSKNTEWKEGVVASSVNGIFQSGNIATANINGVWVKEGDWVGEEQVTDIRKDIVILIGKEKERRELPLRGVETELKVIERVKPAPKEEK